MDDKYDLQLFQQIKRQCAWCLQDIWAKSYLQNLAGQMKLMCRPDRGAPESQQGPVLVKPPALSTDFSPLIFGLLTCGRQPTAIKRPCWHACFHSLYMYCQVCTGLGYRGTDFEIPQLTLWAL